MKIRKLNGSIRGWQLIGCGIVLSCLKAHIIDGGTGKYQLTLQWRKTTSL